MIPDPDPLALACAHELELAEFNPTLGNTQGPGPWTVNEVMAHRVLLAQLQLVGAEEFHLRNAAARFQQLRIAFAQKSFGRYPGTATFTAGIRAELSGDVRGWWGQTLPTLFDEYSRDGTRFTRRDKFQRFIGRFAGAAGQSTFEAVKSTITGAGAPEYAAKFEAPQAETMAFALRAEKDILAVRFAEWEKGFAAEELRRMNGILGRSVVQGESVAQASRNLSRGLNIAYNRAEGIARTVIHRAAYHGHSSFIKRNKKYITRERWQATFDDRTCLICAGLHGRTWPVGAAKEVPPVHLRCRCWTTPESRDPAELGIPLGKHEPGPQFARTGPGRAGWGKVSGSMTFDQFLRQSSKATQLAVLGKRRFELWSSGQVPLGAFSSRALRGIVPLATIEDRLTRSLQAATGQRFSFDNLTRAFERGTTAKGLASGTGAFFRAWGKGLWEGGKGVGLALPRNAKRLILEPRTLGKAIVGLGLIPAGMIEKVWNLYPAVGLRILRGTLELGLPGIKKGISMGFWGMAQGTRLAFSAQARAAFLAARAATAGPQLTGSLWSRSLLAMRALLRDRVPGALASAVQGAAAGGRGIARQFGASPLQTSLWAVIAVNPMPGFTDAGIALSRGFERWNQWDAFGLQKEIDQLVDLRRQKLRIERKIRAGAVLTPSEKATLARVARLEIKAKRGAAAARRRGARAREGVVDLITTDLEILSEWGEEDRKGLICWGEPVIFFEEATEFDIDPEASDANVDGITIRLEPI